MPTTSPELPEELPGQHLMGMVMHSGVPSALAFPAQEDQGPLAWRGDQNPWRCPVSVTRGTQLAPVWGEGMGQEGQLGSAWLSSAWLGLVWLGLAWHGLAWHSNSLARLGKSWHDTGQPWTALGLVWLGTIQLSLAWHCTALDSAWLGLAWLRPARPGLAWHSLAQHGVP